MEDLVQRLTRVKAAICGCESVSVASTDGFVLATTHDELRQGEFLAAVTSMILTSCTRGLAPFKAGQCRALDFRGDRQVLITLLESMNAYLVCVLHPGAQAVNVDEPSLRAVTAALPGVLHGQEAAPLPRFFLERDKCMISVRRGYLVGRADHCDLVLVSPRLEPEHLRFELHGGTLLARDLDTKHGSKLNRKGFTGTVALSPGDRLSLPRAGGFTVVALDPDGKLIGDGARAKRAAKSKPGRPGRSARAR